ncbi:chitobiase/beta-hexosaminidase C-terminal domain-containing protein [Jatrophihabitans sp.]|uniref:chitobiase/beta-hexosaminidase C-terminal domain-containing protein n=1 Tax=Jatrophihabitans sp. TaxID=1932789 RepID=UPI003917612D
MLVAVLVVAVPSVLTASRAATPQTTVTLDFDGNTVSQYNLGYLQALKPHNAAGTFLINSGTVGASAGFMTWTQLGTLAAAGNDIGGKTVNATNLTTDANASTQVCDDRTALQQHGFTPVAFAYPGGATNTSVKTIVKNCGYGNGRTAGSLSPSGPVYAETIPPADWFGLRAYAPSAVTLANMQSLVTGAASHNGGWTQIVVGKICSQSLDPANYSTCTTGSGHIELADLNAFLDWLANAGQSGGAPAGTVLNTVRGLVTGADTSAPTSSVGCNGTACSSAPYPGVVSVSLSATDVGAGVASIRYTTDGSDPTPASQAYTGPFNVNGASSSTTVKYRGYDYAGNAEATKSQTVQAPADTAAPTTTISCNSAACASTGYAGSVTVALSATDTGGSGVSSTYFTTDGTTPTTGSPAYTTPFQLTGPMTYTVQYFSVDQAGNAETVQAQQIRVTAVKTAVSLTFDNGAISQYTLGYQKALLPHNAPATFFVNSGTVGVATNIMTWAQLRGLKAAGYDIGGKTVNATNLTTDRDPSGQVCDDRATLLQQGLTPVAFAYPGGAYNASVQAVVKACGYGNARAAGSVSPSGPTYAETVPPKDWMATRAYAPPGQVTLTAMQSLITGAAAHNGGWTQIVIGRVCSQSQDPGNYTVCSSSSGWIELADLNAFLDWMQAAGQANGAPAGSALDSVQGVVTGADLSAPTTTSACNGAPCSSSTYTSTVRVTLAATDVGSSVAATRYTTNGSDPTSSSALYTAPIPITSTTTVKFRSWDNAGNAEPTNTQVISANLAPDTAAPTTTIACAGAPCAPPGYEGSVSVSLTATDSDGWGVDQTYYTVDGSAPSTSSTAYTKPFTLKTPGTYTVQFMSTDLAGNVEQARSQEVIVLPPKVTVSLTFDDGTQAQYDLGFRQALEPHHLVGTFYDVSGENDVDPEHMTWTELTALNNAGNEVGGHTLHHVDLTSVDTATATTEVCDDRQNLLDHGFFPTTFAYPTGAYNTSVEGIVRNCGYSAARRTGGLDVAGDGAGPVYAESVPPADQYATRTVYNAPTGDPATVAPISLQHLQSAVTAAAQNGGGWVPLVFHLVCSKTLDPSHYTDCINSWGPIELDTFNAFLDWLQLSGQPGGAPPKTSVATVARVLSGPDTQAPVTTLNCDGAPCGSSAYSGSTTVTLNATDPGGSGVQSTHYTEDGTTPTTSSPTYTSPITIDRTTTFKFFSVDTSGNVEPAQTQQVLVQPATDQTAPTTTASCNAAACGSAPYRDPVSVTLTATDNPGGSGVASTHYTTDGSDPSLSSPTYSGAFVVSTTTTVKYRSWDAAGNVEATSTQLISVDSAPPTSTIQCNATACADSAYSGSVSVSLSAVDNSGGSGVAALRYTTDGSDPSTSAPLYSGPFTLTSSTTVKYRAWDVAGNVEATKTQLVQVGADGAPVARLAVSPASGAVPFDVTADASASSDGDATPIASYAFDFGDGSPVVTQAGPQATHTYTTSGTFTVKVTVSDTAKLSGSASQSVSAAANLLKNPGFEQNVSGWTTNASAVSLARVSGGHSGGWAARVTNTGKNAATCLLDDSPNAVGSTVAGTYVASLWVKGAVPGATLTLKLSERSGKSVIGSSTATLALSTSWQLVSVSYRPVSAGSALDFNASVANVAAGAVAFYADDAAIART